MRLVATLPFLSLLGLAAWQDASRPVREVELVYLANEGFLVSVGETRLLIDAFVTEPYGGYAAVPAPLFAELVAGKAPFDGIDLVLASHVHRDHFQAAAAAEFVSASPDTPFVSSPQVLDELAKELPPSPGDSHRRALLPGAAERLEAPAGAIRVELLRLPHSGGARTAAVQNLGHRIELGGARLLHVGDADLEDEALAGYQLADLDVAFVPYWWLGDAADLARTRALTGAKHLVAVHVPPAEVEREKARLAALDPAILLFVRAGESRTLALAR